MRVDDLLVITTADRIQFEGPVTLYESADYITIQEDDGYVTKFKKDFIIQTTHVRVVPNAEDF